MQRSHGGQGRSRLSRVEKLQEEASNIIRQEEQQQERRRQRIEVTADVCALLGTAVLTSPTPSSPLTGAPSPASPSTEEETQQQQQQQQQVGPVAAHRAQRRSGCGGQHRRKGMVTVAMGGGRAGMPPTHRTVVLFSGVGLRVEAFHTVL